MLGMYTERPYFSIDRPLLTKIWGMLLLMLIANCSLFGQFKGIGLPNIRNYTKTEYHSGTQNWDIDQDANGNMYFANNNGLLQFDGSTWRTYGIPGSKNIRSVKVDSDSGKIYVGGYNEFGYFQSDEMGILQYSSLMPKIEEERYRNSDFIWKIHLYGEEVIFQSFKAAYILRDGEVGVIPARQGRFQFSFHVGDKLYFQNTVEGVLEYRNGSFTALEGSKVLNDYEIWGILPLGTQGLLLATLEAGLFVHDGKRVLPWQGEANEMVKANSALGGTSINGESLVLNTVLGGVVLCDLEGKIIQQIDLKRGLKNNTVLSSFIDSGNNLWLGLDNGIAYLNINSPFTYFGSSLYFSSVYATLSHQGLLYVATNQGVFQHDMDGSFLDRSFDLVEGTAAQSWNIQELGGELICANNKGALVIEGGKVVRNLDDIGYYGFREIPGMPDHFLGANYAGFAIFKKGREGLEFKNRVGGFNNSSKDFELESGYVWLLRDHQLYQLELSPELDSFKLHQRVTSLLEDGPGIGTIKKIDNRLYFISDNRFYTYSGEAEGFEQDERLSALFQGLPDISSMYQDPYGNLWYTGADSNSLGVWMKSGDGEFTLVTEPFSNLAGNFVSNYLSINTLDPNNIYIGLIDGLAHYNSGFPSENLAEPRAFIRSFGYGDLTFVQGNPRTLPKTLELPFSQNNVRFTFSSPDFENFDNIQFSYRLDPFDADWSDWSKQVLKEYTNLREGDYTMRVKEKNSYGQESGTASLSFTVSPPWYRNFWAYLLYLSLGALLVYLVRLQVRAKIRKNKYYETLLQRKMYLERESKIRMEQFKLEKKIQKMNRDRLKTKILAKDKELVNNSLQVVKKNKTLNNIVHKIKELNTDGMNAQTKSQLASLKKSIVKEINGNSWKDLEKHIKNVHFEFLKRLKEKHPNISPRELDLSTYCLMNMSTKEIAEVMNISNGGVELARYRLRKKLGLKRKENLTGFLMNI